MAAHLRALATGVGLGLALASVRPALAEDRLTFRDPAGWSTEDRTVVEDAFAAAPAALQTPVTVGRGPTPTTPDRLAAPHALVEWRGSELRLAVDGLRAAAAAWSSGQTGEPLDVDALLRRAVLHGLVHAADRRAGWSRTARWRQISGWGLFGGPPAEGAPGAFAAPEARESQGEDLASTVTAVLDAATRPTLDVDQDPRCRLPSKVRFVVDILGALPTRECPGLGDLGLDPANIEEIELVYAAGSTASLASIAGHVFVTLASTPNAGGGVTQDSYALVANTTGPMTLRTALSGLVGGLPSMILRSPFELVLQGYAYGDNRDVRRYALKLDAAQKERFLRRLDELRQGWDRPYAFLTRNCTALGVELIRAALEEDFHPPTPLSPETFLGMLDRRGLLQPVPTDRTDALAIGSRALTADRLRVRAARTLTRGDPTLGAPLRDALAPTDTRRRGGYAALAERPAVSLDTLLALDQFLAWSDGVEQTAAANAKGERGAPEALRAAKAAIRTQALALGADYGSFQPGEAELLAAAAPPRDKMGTHSTLRGYQVWAEFGPGLVGWVGGQTALFDSRVGEPRRYAPGANSAYTLFATRVAVSTEGKLRLGGELAGVTTLTPTRGPFATGLYGQLGVTERWEPASGQSELRWLEAGGLLALWGGQEGGLLAWLSGGVALATRGGSDTALLERLGVEAPVGLLVRADSAREALTGLSLSLRWAPRLSGAGRVTARSTGSAEGRVRLGEAFGSDVGLTLNGTLVGEDLRQPTRLTPAVQLGLRVERF